MSKQWQILSLAKSKRYKKTVDIMQRLQMQHYRTLSLSYIQDVFFPTVRVMQKACVPMISQYSIAGKQIRVYWYNQILYNRLSRALSHHVQKNEHVPVDFTVHVLDTLHSHVLVGAPDIINASQSTSAQYTVNSGNPFGVLWHDRSLQVCNPTTREGFFWVHDAYSIPNWVSAAPLRGLLSWFFDMCGMQLVHGAVFGTDKASILLSAKSGSGKSTTAVASLLSGLLYVSDDYSIVDMNTPARVYNMYNTVKLLPDTLAVFPQLHTSNVWNATELQQGIDEKGIISFFDIPLAQTRDSLPLAAICIPSIVDRRETCISSATSMEAYRALVPSTLFQLPLPSNQTQQRLRQLVEMLPCFHVQLGRDRDNIPQKIRHFIDTTF